MSCFVADDRLAWLSKLLGGTAVICLVGSTVGGTTYILGGFIYCTFISCVLIYCAFIYCGFGYSIPKNADF